MRFAFVVRKNKKQKIPPKGGTTNRVHSFVLLEIIVAMVILGMAMAAVLRGYANGLKALSKDRNVTEAGFLAQSLINQFEIDAPEEDSVEGNFGSDFPRYSYKAEFDLIELKYKDIETKLDRKKLEGLRKVRIEIYRASSTRGGSPELVLGFETYLTKVEKFAPRTMFTNALF
jgi:type II secretory pathway pseudopilin PulG